MSQDMLGVVADIVTQLRNGSLTEEEAKRFARRENPFSGVVQEKVILLERVAQIEVGDTARFVVGDHFKTKDTPDGVQLLWMNGYFEFNFLAKIEKPMRGFHLQKSRITKKSLDKPILDELGGRATIALAHLWELLKNQSKGGKGDLLVNGYANIFYIEDANGKPWAVYAYWYAGRGWRVGAFSVSRPDGWGADDMVFSR